MQELPTQEEEEEQQQPRPAQLEHDYDVIFDELYMHSEGIMNVLLLLQTQSQPWWLQVIRSNNILLKMVVKLNGWDALHIY